MPRSTELNGYEIILIIGLFNKLKNLFCGTLVKWDTVTVNLGVQAQYLMVQLGLIVDSNQNVQV